MTAIAIGGQVISTTSVTITTISSDYVVVSGTPIGPVDVVGISAGSNGQRLIISNQCGQDISFIHESGVAGSPSVRIRTVDGSTHTILDDSVAEFIYDTTMNRWQKF